MQRHKQLFLFAIALLTVLTVFTSPASATSTIDVSSRCVIPESGPWPPCATGGNSSGNDCVIPPSGPWPPCATGGENSGNNGNECVIPPSGPWPPCATGGGNGGNPSNDCVIPPSGPWPPCATGGTTPNPSGNQGVNFTCRPDITIPQAECNALVTFYRQINGRINADNGTWLNSNSPCNWGGVTCANGRITRLDLRGDYGDGSIPNVFAPFSELTYLDLSEQRYCRGGGTSVQQCSNDPNTFSGTLPWSIGRLTKLQTLLVNGHNLTAPLPNLFGDLKQLETLEITGRYIPFSSGQTGSTGSIPDSIGQLSSLKKLHLTGRFTGSIPASLGQLNNLTSLELSGEFPFNIPPSIPKLDKLQTLKLYGKMSGPLPHEFNQLQTIDTLVLSSEWLFGELSPLNTLTSFRHLDLSNTNLGGPMPVGWHNAHDAESVAVSPKACVPDNPLFREWWEPFDRGINLQVPDCVNPTTPETFSCAMVTTIPHQECTALVAFYNDNPQGWSSNLLWLMTENPCDWFGVECFHGHVSEISLFPEAKIGRISPQLAQLKQLTTLRIDGSFGDSGWNWGTIPAELGQLTMLRFIGFDNLGLTGSIPQTFGNLSNLVVLSLSGNELSGSLPASLGNITTLREMRLRDNHFTGSIPATYANFGNISTLMLNQNPTLSGSLPLDFGNIQRRHFLTLDRTNVCIPQSLVEWYETAKLFPEEVTRVCP